jgi:hypothetical protein
MQKPGPLEHDIPIKQIEKVTIRPKKYGAKRYVPRAQETCWHFGIQFLVMGWGMLIWLRGQGLFSRQTVVERKEIIPSVDDDTEHVKRIPIRKKNR